MKALNIWPEDIGASGEWSDDWINFCLKFGYSRNNIPAVLILVNIQIETDE